MLVQMFMLMFACAQICFVCMLYGAGYIQIFLVLYSLSSFNNRPLVLTQNSIIMRTHASHPTHLHRNPDHVPPTQFKRRREALMFKALISPAGGRAIFALQRYSESERTAPSMSYEYFIPIYYTSTSCKYVLRVCAMTMGIL